MFVEDLLKYVTVSVDTLWVLNAAYQEIINKAFKEVLDNVMKPNWVLSGLILFVQDYSDLTVDYKWFAFLWRRPVADKICCSSYMHMCRFAVKSHICYTLHNSMVYDPQLSGNNVFFRNITKRYNN